MTDTDLLASYLSDAAHYPDGAAKGAIFIDSEADVAAALALGISVLPLGAQSSLTGGATPRGDLLLVLRSLRDIGVSTSGVTAGAGVSLDLLAEQLAPWALAYPPVPTFTGATVGGVIATNAAGPATFKHGTTRQWVQGLTIVLACGEVLDVERGQCHAHPSGYFEIHTSRGILRVPIQPLSLPDVPKCSAGYALAAHMDLLDLFIGAEGTLGVVTNARLRVLREPPSQVLALVGAETERQTVALAADLRAAAMTTWRSRDDRGIDVAAIEHADGRAVTLVREDGADRELGLDMPPEARTWLFVALDVPADVGRDAIWQQVEQAMEPGAADSPIGRFCRLVHAHGLLDCTQIALPDEVSRRKQFAALREAIPLAVNRRIARAQQELSPAISKTAGDFIVPFPAFQDMVQACHQACAARQLDLAVWGHISDGNIHPNIVPGSATEMALARDALLEAGRAVIRLGGSPLAEHGVGRNPLKQQFLELLHGPGGLAAMWAVKRALDPAGVLSPGVLLPIAP